MAENYPELFDKAKMELYHFVNYNNFSIFTPSYNSKIL